MNSGMSAGQAFDLELTWHGNANAALRYTRGLAREMERDLERTSRDSSTS